MLTLKLDKHRVFKPGEVVHLRVVGIQERSAGRWELSAEDVTPLPCADPPFYTCPCGIGQPAKEDGSLPEGWVLKRFEESPGCGCFCPSHADEQMCRVCGCTQMDACETKQGRCFWVEPDLCSACAEKREGNG